MTLFNYEPVRESDWVSGTTLLDEKFIGFVQSIVGNGVIKVFVTQSDREEIVGDTIRTTLAKSKKLAETTPSSPEEVRSLIELALDTHDKEWFDELHASMNPPSTTASDLLEGYTLTKVRERL